VLCRLLALTLPLWSGPVLSAADAGSGLPAQARRETAIPIRPGEPGVRPFWNRAAVQFLHAPAFDFAPVAGARTYHFEVAGADGQRRAFSAPVPFAPLSPVWADLPVGVTTLRMQARDERGQALGEPRERTFHRAAPFDDSYPRAASGWRDSAQRGLAALVHSPDLKCWFAGGEPEERFHLYRYPYKIVGAAAAALAVYATQQPAPADAAEALRAARRAADYLLGLCFPTGAVWADHPPTYHPTRYRERLKGHMLPENHMTTSGAEGGLYFLTLATATGELRYREAAVRIAETYARTQRSDGSWPLFVRAQDGALVTDNVMVPTRVVDFLDRLERATADPRFNAVRDRAVAWIEANPVRTWNWQGQFEDVKPQPAYENLTKHDACDYALHLLRAPNPPARDRELALEILRFAEDQFVIWAQPPTTRPGAQSADGVAGAKSRTWLLPCVVEQYRAYAPVCASSAKLIRTFLAAYRVTRDPLHLAKARALAATLTRTQANAKAPDRYLTWVMQPSGLMWFNCELLAVEALQELAAADPAAG
jgi:maltose/maltodextrin transport system substrate-binding protein